MAARRNRKSSNIELLQQQSPNQFDQTPPDDVNEINKTPQKSKRKAPAPPSRSNSSETNNDIAKNENIIDSKMMTNGIDTNKKFEQTNVNKMEEKPTAKKVQPTFCLVTSLTIRFLTKNNH